MKIKLHTETVIDSAHKLEGYDGLCSNLHGHSWKIDLWFKGDIKDVDDVGILVDFTIVKELKEQLDHKYINDVVKVNPTAENLIGWIYNFIKQKIGNNIEVKIRLYETAVGKETWCEGGDFE